jgi:hypothetical protein
MVNTCLTNIGIGIGILFIVFIIITFLIPYKVLSFIFLSNNGSFFTNNNTYDIKDNNFNLNIYKHHFLGNYTFVSNKDKFNEIITKLKYLDIFSYERDNKVLKTVIHRKDSDKPVKIDDVVSVTTRFMNDNLFTTSYEKVAILEENDNSFIMCMTSSSENIINGYYRIKIYFDEKTNSITINYAKVQSVEPFLLKTLINMNEQKYIDANINSVKNTIQFLSGKDDFKIENVIHNYNN